MAASWVPSINFIVDGQPVAAATDNQALTQLTQRTQYLFEQLQLVAAGKQLVLNEQTVQAGVSVGETVYIDTTDNIFKPAEAAIDQDNLNLADDRAFWQGIVQTVAGTTASIVIGGAMELTTVEWAAVQDEGVFTAGDMFLSPINPGNITGSPGTNAIYVGHLRSTGEMIVRLGTPGSFIDHVHLQRQMLGKPAGVVVDPAFNAIQSVNAPDANEQGWLPANVTYFPGYVVGVQIPTGAKFGYNIQHPNEEDLREIFPVIPPENAEFQQGGVILGTDLVVINQYGIWWMDNTYGNAPWPVDYNADPTAADITIWTARIIASTSVIDIVVAQLEAEIAAGDLDSVLVRSVISTDQSSLLVNGTLGDNTNGWTGELTFENLGVTGLRYGRGLNYTSGTGNNTSGWKKLVDANLDAALPATHNWTVLTAGGDKLQPLSTNGFSAGVDLGTRGHVLGANTALDYIDFFVEAGSDLVAGVDYQVTTELNFTVDTPAAGPIVGDVNITFYAYSPGDPMSDAGFQRLASFQGQTGLPGQLQTATVGPFADVFVQQGQTMLVRISNNTGGTPLTAGTLRLVSLLYRLTPV